MSHTPPTSSLASDSLSGPSREEVRQRFLAACEASHDGGPPPDLDSFLAAFPEPERSELRAELEALAGSSREHPPLPADPGAVTTDIPAREVATLDEGPRPTPPTATVDFVSPSPAGTIDHVPAETGGTLDYVSGEEPGSAEASGAGARKGPPAPRTVAGYEVLRVLGRGAMGIVYKARQRGLKRIVALKMILAGSHASEGDLVRFRSEAEAVAQLQHPNIVQLFEVGEEDGRPFFSLEYVDGQSLDAKVRGTPLPPREAAQLVQKIAEAMEYAHRHGVIHRDLKPANVLLTSDGAPKISDFGLAKRLEDDSSHTQTNTVLGTPSYMAPEQAEGRIRDVGPLSDVYALGAILYELLSGRAPFRGATLLETLEQVRTREPVAPTQFQPGVPRDLETIALKCLQKDPGKRYPSARALGEDLGRFLAGEPIQARPVSRAERAWRWCKRNPRTAGLIGTVAALIVVWGVTASLLAWGLAVQQGKTREALELATQNEAKANHEAQLAKENEQRAKATADNAFKGLIDLGGQLHNRLQSKRLSIQATPEVGKLREEVLNLLRQSLTSVSQKIETAGTTTFAQAANRQALGDLMGRLGQTGEARKLHEEAYAMVKKIVDAEPENDQARANLGVAIQRLGDVALEMDGDARKARDRYLEARDLHRDILAHPHQRPERQSKIDISHDDLHLGWAYLSLGQPAEARQSFEECLKYRQEWSAAEPSSIEARSYVMQAFLWLGIAASHLVDEKAGEQHFGEALRRGEGLLKEVAPKYVPEFKGDLAEVQGAHGDALLRLGKLEDADREYQESLKNLRPLLDSKPDDMSLQPVLALAHERLGAVHLRLGKRPEAEEHYAEALKLRTELLQIEMSNVPRKAAYVLALARAGKHAEAAGGAAKVQPQVGQSTELLLQIARSYATCAASDTPQKAQYSRAAVEAVRLATQRDYKDAAALLTDPDLEPIRGEMEFKKIVDEVKAR